MKQKMLYHWTRITGSSSFRWPVFVIISAIIFKVVDLAFGFLPALTAAAIVATLFPVWQKRCRLAHYNMVRWESLTAIQAFFEKAGKERTWKKQSPSQAKETEERFGYARRRALEIHKELIMRARHLDRCFKEGTAPYPGADWSGLKQRAEAMVNMVESAAWVCEQGMLGVNHGLLDPDWKPDFIIHDGKPEPELQKPYRVVVAMAEFEHLRGHRLRPQHDGKIVDFDPRPTSAHR